MQTGDKVKYTTLTGQIGFGVVAGITDGHVQINDKRSGVVFIDIKRVEKL